MQIAPKTFRGTVVLFAIALISFASGNVAFAKGFKVLYTFCAKAGCSDGQYPEDSLIVDKNGDLFGTTNGGGGANCENGCGTIFKLDKHGIETVLYSYCPQFGCDDGEYPAAGVLKDKSGNLYATATAGGGHSGCINACGTIIKMAPDGAASVLYDFCSQPQCSDGGVPYGGLITDRDGNIYGTTQYGGINANFGGTVFTLTPDGTETVRYKFCPQPGCSDGETPLASLMMDKTGNLIGTVFNGGIAGCFGEGCGGVFKVPPNGTETALYTFCSLSNCSDGSNPQGNVIMDKQGNLYGTTFAGGNTNCTFGCGTVFKVAPDGAETVLYAFTGGNDGYNSYAGLITDEKGNLYGTTSAGGVNRGGTVFKLAPNGKLTVLYAFCSQANCNDGEQPWGGLVADKRGNLFGTTKRGGANGGGTVFSVKE